MPAFVYESTIPQNDDVWSLSRVRSIRKFLSRVIPSQPPARSDGTAKKRKRRGCDGLDFLLGKRVSRKTKPLDHQHGALPAGFYLTLLDQGKGRGQNRELQINARLALRKFQSYSPTIDEMFTRGVGCACGPIVEFPRF
ncbi:hypothetical protein TGMAS_315705 [Toxoplasma gondii MAS]|uniref:Uncharacterized protein n=1 Tax=Toxoplasma gondii MAS TaxID=943118 RepID=A0A086R0A3_TOXGO|nr:hypothetical protein TGMAS_315705 [Toxoplasma gondii MAS]